MSSTSLGIYHEPRVGCSKKKDYFKINASLGSNEDSVRRISLIATIKTTSGNHSLSPESSDGNVREVYLITIKKTTNRSQNEW